MINDATAQDRMRAVLVIVATIATIVFNGLAAAGYVNGITPAMISQRHPSFLTPAGYAFTIWGLIYAGLIGFSIFQMASARLALFRPIRSLYIFSCVLNCAWIFFWHREQIALCFAIIVMLVGTLLLIKIKLQDVRSFAETWAVQAPFGIYFGWTTAAALVNFAVLLAFVGVKMEPVTESAVGAVLIVIATLAAVAVRIKLSDFFFPIAVAWALTGIAVNQGRHTAIVAAAAFGVVFCMVTTGSFVVNLKDSTSE